MKISSLFETFHPYFSEKNTAPTKHTRSAAENTIALAELFMSDPNLRAGLIKELITTEFQGCSAVLAKQNQLDAKAVTHLIQRECLPAAQLALENSSKLFSQLLGVPSATSKDYYLTPEVEIEFRAFCLSLARKVPVQRALNPDGPDIDGVRLWLMLGTLYVIAHVIALRSEVST